MDNERGYGVPDLRSATPDGVGDKAVFVNKGVLFDRLLFDRLLIVLVGLSGLE